MTKALQHSQFFEDSKNCFNSWTYIFIGDEEPIFPHELSDSNEASHYHATDQDNEDTTKIGQA